MNIGSQLAIPPFEWKSSRPSPQPHWKNATMTPYAAATESRLRTIALSAITIDLNETSSRPSANRRTTRAGGRGRGSRTASAGATDGAGAPWGAWGGGRGPVPGSGAPGGPPAVAGGVSRRGGPGAGGGASAVPTGSADVGPPVIF